MNREIKLLVMVCLSMLFLVGWGEKKIELLDNNKLINLDKAIEYAKPGGSWEKNGIISDSIDDPAEEHEETKPEKNDTQEDVEVGDSNTKYINVNEETISYCGSVVSRDELRDLLKRDNGDDIRFVLVDDWAEAHVYRAVKAILTEAKDSIGITFSEEM